MMMLKIEVCVTMMCVLAIVANMCRVFHYNAKIRNAYDENKKYFKSCKLHSIANICKVIIVLCVFWMAVSMYV